MHPNSREAVDQAIQTYAPGFISDPVFETLLHTPVLIFAAVIGLAAYLLGMRRRALYAALIIASVALVGFDLFGREHSLLLAPLNELWTNLWPQRWGGQPDLASGNVAQDYNGEIFGLPTLLLIGLAGLSLALLSKSVGYLYRSQSREHDAIEKASETAVHVATEKRSEKSELATALGNAREFHQSRSIQRRDQHPDVDGLVLHAPGLRSGTSKSKRAYSGGVGAANSRAISDVGTARHDPKPYACPHRNVSR